jgi:hypothetical protein
MYLIGLMKSPTKNNKIEKTNPIIKAITPPPNPGPK